MVLKSFIFKFVNAFCSLYYIAFLQEEIYPAGNTNTEIITLLRTQLIALFGTALVIQNTMEVALPPLLKMGFAWWARNALEEKDENIQKIPISAAEQQFGL